jgi:hypothetical protein
LKHINKEIPEQKEIIANLTISWFIKEITEKQFFGYGKILYYSLLAPEYKY